MMSPIRCCVGIALALLLSPAVIAAPCTTVQRTELTKPGYGRPTLKPE